MMVLVTGASGFIGRRLCEALNAAGHRVVRAAHTPAYLSDDTVSECTVSVDFTTDLDPAVWLPRLAGVDAVINAVGILQERGRQTFEAIHVLAPQALFSACAIAKVPRVIQISALGADEEARSPYHLSKRRADDFLADLPLNWTIVQPSLVYGPGGASTRLFTGLASLPFIPLPGHGQQLVQPVHLDDTVEAIVKLLSVDDADRARVHLVGPAPLTLRDFLQRLRIGMQLGAARFIDVPLALVRMGTRLNKLSPVGLLDADTLNMLLRGNIGDPQPIKRLLGREPRGVAELIPPEYAHSVRLSAQLQWLLPPLRWAVALVWIVTGAVSLGLYPRHLSYDLLARVGVTGTWAPALLYGAASLNLFFGVATLLLRRRRVLWLAQIAVILAYTVLITWKLPEFWLHPYGPILKNLPLLAGIWMLYQLERR
jgi:uncharacterized protein YbjT (DUF2867 family)